MRTSLKKTNYILKKYIGYLRISTPNPKRPTLRLNLVNFLDFKEKEKNSLNSYEKIKCLS